MPLPADNLQQVRELLKKCSAELRGIRKNKSGTGFFITDRHLLTCAHVSGVEKGTEVDIAVPGRSLRKGTVIDVMPDEARGDLALVEAKAMAEGEFQPTVVLDRTIVDNIAYYAVGYPYEEQLRSTGQIELEYKGSGLSARDETTVELLKLHAGGATIVGGLSGCPILSSESGAVVAIMQYAVDQRGDTGGGAIPIARAAERFPLVRQCIEQPPLQARPWREALGREAWLAMRKPPVWRDCVDLTLSGDHRRWSVRFADDEGEVVTDLTSRDLPPGASKALFRWSQQRGVDNREDAQFLGELLAAAIFPEKIAARLRRHLPADDLVVRLHIDESDEDLFSVAWEDALLDGGQGEGHISVAKGMRMVRVAENHQPAEIATPPALEAAGVIGVVVQPPKLQAQMPVVRHHSQPVKWPSKEGIAKGLRSNLQEARFPGETLSNPNAGVVMERLEKACPPGMQNAVVHYIGFGKEEEGKALLALVEEGDLAWRQAVDLFDWVERSGARMLVVELLPAPKGEVFEPISPRAFLSALRGGVDAVLFTRFGVHPRALLRFNGTFYGNLARGETVEVAVQRARRTLHDNQVLGDEVGFGYFPLITRAQGPAHIVQPGEEQGSTTLRQRGDLEPPRPGPAAPPLSTPSSYQGAA